MGKSAQKRLEDCQRIIGKLSKKIEDYENGCDAAVAAIEYALEDDEGIEFLRLWNEGEFITIRDEWENVPDEVFIGADPLFKRS